MDQIQTDRIILDVLDHNLESRTAIDGQIDKRRTAGLAVELAEVRGADLDRTRVDAVAVDHSRNKIFFEYLMGAASEGGTSRGRKGVWHSEN